MKNSQENVMCWKSDSTMMERTKETLSLLIRMTPRSCFPRVVIDDGWIHKYYKYFDYLKFVNTDLCNNP